MQVIALLTLLVLAAASRSITGTWMHPSSVTTVSWASFLGMPILAGLQPAPRATWLILLLAVGSLIASPIHVSAAEAHPRRIRTTPTVAWVAIAGGMTGGLAGLITLRANGLAPADMMSLAGINLAAREATVLRYSGELTVPSLAILLLAVTYAAALVAPFAADSKRGWRRALLLAAPSIGGALFAVATTARAGFLIAAAITAGGWIVVRGVSSGGRPRMPVRTLIGLVSAGIALGGLFVYSALTRIGGWGPGVGQLLVDRFAVYAGGGIPAYDRWYANRIEGAHIGWGSQTFAGVSQFWVSDPNIGDAYDDRVDIGRGLSTNVYTILRPLTEDFTVAGAVGFLVVVGVLAAWSYRHAVTQGSVVSAVATAVWLGVVLFSSTTSILSFANVCCGLALAFLVLVRGMTLPRLAEDHVGVVGTDAGLANGQKVSAK